MVSSRKFNIIRVRRGQVRFRCIACPLSFTCPEQLTNHVAAHDPTHATGAPVENFFIE